uniref:Resolvase/integrase-like protein n=1 Tax=Histophilus somni (strain 129Pt) TaxID=205914 RepID=Q0I2A9_HISS1
MALLGFARVSTQSQSLLEQENALKAFGCTKIFSGKHSGKASDNKQALDELLSYVREGDRVVVTRLDRLGRSLNQCLNTLEYFRENKIGFVAIQQGIDTEKKNDPLATAYIHLLGLFAEMERSFIVERTQGGKIAKIAAGDNSAIGGRPRKIGKDTEKALIKDIKKGVKIGAIAEKYKVSRITIYNYKKRLNI